MINKYKKLIIVLIIFFLIATIFIFNQEKLTKKESNSNTQPLTFSHTWYPSNTLSRTTIEFKQSELHISSLVDNSKMPPSESNVEMSINNTNYPKLFAQGAANMSRINTYLLEDFRDKYDGKLIAIENQQPSHGDYSPYYELIVSPFEAKVVFETPKYMENSRFPMIVNYPLENYLRVMFERYQFDSCNSCNLSFLNIYEYNTEKSSFELANSKHRDELGRYLTQFNKLAESGCFYQGKKRSFSEIQQVGGNDAKCESSDGAQINDPLSMEKFYAVTNRLKKIVNGENVSMFE